MIESNYSSILGAMVSHHREGARLLSALQIDLERLKRNLRDMPPVDPLELRARGASEAVAIGHSYVDDAHLVLAMISSPISGRAFASQGISLEDARRQVTQLYGTSTYDLRVAPWQSVAARFRRLCRAVRTKLRV